MRPNKEAPSESEMTRGHEKNRIIIMKTPFCHPLVHLLAFVFGRAVQAFVAPAHLSPSFKAVRTIPNQYVTALGLFHHLSLLIGQTSLSFPFSSFASSSCLVVGHPSLLDSLEQYSFAILSFTIFALVFTILFSSLAVPQAAKELE